MSRNSLMNWKHIRWTKSCIKLECLEWNYKTIIRSSLLLLLTETSRALSLPIFLVVLGDAELPRCCATRADQREDDGAPAKCLFHLNSGWTLRNPGRWSRTEKDPCGWLSCFGCKCMYTCIYIYTYLDTYRVELVHPWKVTVRSCKMKVGSWKTIPSALQALHLFGGKALILDDSKHIAKVPESLIQCGLFMFIAFIYYVIIVFFMVKDTFWGMVHCCFLQGL